MKLIEKWIENHWKSNENNSKIIRKSMTIITNQLKNIENQLKRQSQKPDFLSRNEKINGNRALERFSYMFWESGWNPIYEWKIRK